MFPFISQKYGKRLSRNLAHNRPGRRPAAPGWHSLRLERLEDRLVPASIISVIPTGTGTLDGFLSATDGTIATSDGGNTPGTLSIGALEGVNSNVDISISALHQLDFTPLGPTTLALQTAAGHTAAFNAGDVNIIFDPASTLTTAGARLSLTATTSINPCNLASSGGDISLTADNLSILPPINAGTGKVILAPKTAGRTIDLGTNSASSLGLSDTELAQVTASVLRLSTTGAITVSGAITRHAGYSTLSLQSGTGISQTAPLSVASLDAFSANGTVNLGGIGNDMDTLAGQASGGNFFFSDANSVTVGTVDFDTGVATGGGDILLQADNLVLTQAVNAGSGAVDLGPTTPSLTIDLGGASVPGSTFGLTDAELGQVTAGVLRLSTTGAITVSGAVTRHAGYSTLSLQSVTGISQTAPLSVASLDAFSANGNVNLTNPGNDMDTIAGQGSGGNFFFSDANSVTVGAADFDTGVQNLGGDILLRADNLVLTQPVNAGTGVVVLGPTTPSLTVDLGAASVPGFTFGLTDAELGEVTAGVLRLTTTGVITVSGAVARHAGYFALSLQAGTDISQTATMSVARLDAFSANGTVDLANPGNDVDTIAGLAAGGAFSYTDANSVTVGTVDFDIGVATGGGDIALTAGNLVLTQPVNAGSGAITLTSTGVGGITVNAIIDPTSITLSSADDIVINSALSATDLIRATAGTDGSGSVIVSSTGSLSQTTAGTTGIQLSAGSTTGEITLQGSVSAADTLAMTAPSSAINFESSVVAGNVIGSAKAITFNSTGTVDTTAAAGPNTGEVNLTATQSIFLSGGSITTSAGAITLSANQQATAASGSFAGVTVNGATVSSATGSVLVMGRGGDTGVNQFGVLLQGGAQIRTTGSGPVTVQGSGGASDGSFAVGVLIVGAGSQVTSGGGAVLVTGQGGGSGGSTADYGVEIEPGGAVSAGGTGTVTVHGIGGAGSGSFEEGVLVRGSQVTSAGGAVQVTGQGGGTGGSGNDIGVDLFSGGVVSAGGTGTVTVQGTGGAGSGGLEEGVRIAGAGSQVTSGGGAVEVTGSAGADSLAVDVSGGLISSGGNAPITVTGDSMGLAGPTSISAGTGTVTLQPFSSGQLINVGGADGAGTLGLDGTDLGNVTAATLQVGNSASGNITVSAAIAPAHVSTLDLETAGGVTQSMGATLTIPSLAIRAVNTVVLNQANDVTTGVLAANVIGSGQGFTFTDANGLTVGSVDGLAGVTASGTVQLTAGSDFTLPAGQTVQAMGSVTLAGGADGGGAVITIHGAVTGSSVDVNGGTGSDTFNVTPGATAALNIHGDFPAPPANPGDTLSVDLTGTTNPVVTAVSIPATGLQGSWTFDNRQNVNFDTIETLLSTSDIGLSQTAPGTGVEGSPVTFTITVVNNGPTDDPSLSVTDTLPAGSTFVSATASQGTFMVSGGVVTFDVGALANGASATLTVTVTPVEDGPLTNTASVTASGSPDPLSGNDSSTATVTVAEPPITSTATAVAGFELTPLVNVAVATFSHANGVELPNHFSATINWGDGTTSAGPVVRAGAGYQVLGSHTYTDEGTFALSVSVTDDGVATVLPGTADIREELLPGGIRGTHGQRGVNEIFRELFGMPASPSNLATLGAALDRGLPPSRVVQNLLSVPSLQTLFRVKLTAALLQMTQGAPPSPALLAAAFQFLRRHSFVQLTQALTGLSTVGAQAKFVEVLYRSYLGRLPEAAGLVAWVGELRRGVSEQIVVAGIVGSQEFFNKTAQ